MLSAHLSVDNEKALQYFQDKEDNIDWDWGGIYVTKVSSKEVCFKTREIPEEKLVQLSREYPLDEFSFFVCDDWLSEEYVVRNGVLCLIGSCRSDY